MFAGAAETDLSQFISESSLLKYWADYTTEKRAVSRFFLVIVYHSGYNQVYQSFSYPEHRAEQRRFTVLNHCLYAAFPWRAEEACEERIIMEWKNVSVFISSTFRDMHAERDLLLKKVFPVLSEWCARRHLRLYDIDLRWGITSADAGSRNTVEVCLRNVDRCRPFFLCFLGQRRGWVPDRDGINPEAYDRWPDLEERVGKRSVTEMEIEHALLAPMISLVNGRREIPEEARRALFFIRDDAWLADLNPEQRVIYTNEGEKDAEQADASHAAFVSRVRKSWSAVYDYSCRFDRTLRTEELREEGEACAQGRLTDFTVQGKPLDRFVIEKLQEQILEAFPDRAQEVSGESGEPEAERQERRAEEVRRGTVERKELTGQLADYCCRPDNRILWVHGRAGSGKTTLLSRFYEAYAGGFDRRCLRFCGVTQASSRWGELWRGILEEMGTDPGSETEFRENLAACLKRIAEKGSVLILIDGVDELQEGLASLAWLPAALPDGLRLIISFRSDAKDAGDLLNHLKTLRGTALCEVKPLSGKEEITELIRSYLEHYLKAMDDEQIRAICENPAASNPLFLKIVLRELRVFGAFGQVTRQIEAYGRTPESAFARMLEDLEKETGYNPVSAEVFVPRLMGVLARVRGGIRLPVLRKVLFSLLPGTEEQISDTLSYYLRRLEPYLLADGETLAVSYRTLQESALARYASLAAQQHEALAEAFRGEDPLECLYHYRMAGKGNEVAALSEDIAFLCSVIRLSGAPALSAELKASAQAGIAVNGEVRDCLEQTAALTGRDSRTGAALFYKELRDPVLRSRAAQACEGPWLRYEPVPFTVPEDPEPGSFRTLFSIENRSCESFCIAKEKGIAWVLRGESDVSACSLAEGTEGPAFILPAGGRVRKIACSPDGTLLAFAAEDLSLTVCRAVLDDALRVLAMTPALTDACASVRFGGICLFSAPDGLIWQRPDGTVVSYTGADSEPVTAPAEQERLVGCFAGGTVWKGTDGTSLLTDSGCRIPLQARVNDAVLHEGILFLAAEDRKLTVIDPRTGRTEWQYPLPAESLGSLAVCGGEVYGADRYGALVRFRNGGVEDLGRITRGDNMVDAGTCLAALPDGKIAYLSMQRRAVLSTASERRRARLLRFWPENNGIALLWGTGRRMIAVFPDGQQVSAEYPDFVRAGRNLNEINNLMSAVSPQALLYESGSGTLNWQTPDDGGTIRLGGDTGMLRDLRYIPEKGTFQAVTETAQFREISGRMDAMGRIDLARSDSGLYVLCPCGTRTAVLSRRVQIREEGAANAYFADVLTMVENGRVLWTRNLPRAETHVSCLLYDRAADQLNLFYTLPRMEILSLQTGETVGQKAFPAVQYEAGAAMRGGKVYAVSGSVGGVCMTVTSLETQEEIRLPSHHRVRRIEEGGAGVFVQEGDERLFQVFPETGK